MLRLWYDDAQLRGHLDTINYNYLTLVSRLSRLFHSHSSLFPLIETIRPSYIGDELELLAWREDRNWPNCTFPCRAWLLLIFCYVCSRSLLLLMVDLRLTQFSQLPLSFVFYLRGGRGRAVVDRWSVSIGAVHLFLSPWLVPDCITDLSCVCRLYDSSHPPPSSPIDK